MPPAKGVSGERLIVWCVKAKAPGGRRWVLLSMATTRAQARRDRYNMLSSYPYSRLIVRRFEEAADAAR